MLAKMANQIDYLTELNPAQRAAVVHQNGPLLVIAGAGAGKTKTITHRIFHLLQNGAAPQEILAITFTNKAAEEMRERLHRLLETNLPSGNPFPGETNGGQPWVSTFHALGARLIKDNLRAFHLPKFFKILDKDDSLKIIKDAMKEAGAPTEGNMARRLQSVISRQKNLLRTPDDYGETINRHDFFRQLAAEVWRRYERILGQRGALDFDDLLLKTVWLLENNPPAREHYQNQWRHIHIDEYQDTNAVQYRLARLLAQKWRNICVVGDIDQSIYSWRGADFENILRFEKDYPDAKVIMLEENYRSTKTILDFANQVIAVNKKRKEKNLFTRKSDGEKIELIIGFDEDEEAALVAETAKAIIDKKQAQPEEIGVLYRANFQSRAIEEAMLQAQIPHQVLGTRFFERQEIKDVLAIIRSSLNPEDIESTKRIINVPPRGIDKATLAKIFSNQIADLPAPKRAQIESFRRVQTAISNEAARARPAELIKFAINRSGLEKMLADSKDETDRERLENIKELVTLAAKYDHLPPGEALWQFLTETALLSDQDTLEKQSGVKLMTVHAAKGLEFKQVFVVGLEQDLFPSAPRLNEDAERDDEEERRLFYVAVTRAKEKLYLSYAENRTLFGNRQTRLPSEFLAHLDEKIMAAKEPKWLIDF